MSAPPVNPWTDERVEILKALWAEGYSASQVAKKLNCGLTRNAVIGKVSRLKLAKRFTEVSLSRTSNQNRGGAAALRRARASSGKRIAAPRKPHGLQTIVATSRLKPLPPQAPPPVCDASLAKPWTERKIGECAAVILGDGADAMSCCQPADASGYCKYHVSRFFVAPVTNAKNLARSLRRWTA